ncbi:PEP-CTERM-box response regulator transcription factor [Thiohalobacter thiocyanaticus]|uniref:PEP-CTERM-box response regulator transcription factor n=1 Tax=Thiohalobacter thiocyanaticus TaxID=585455 RepID=A0A426QM16_9GAMM|nr:PEP-CTERM-box response regulator transcription factor [Thiohalobacter thiocyanaticus]RRQ22814.1 PEP-CTERM-box response regulator transcription factor [Thiohalobacter thiocyanaticus]
MNARKKTLLIVEDDPGLQSALKWSFDEFEVVTASDRESAIAQLRRYEPAVVTLDLGLPPDPGGASEGLATLGQILSMAPRTKVIVVTGNNDSENAIRAIAEGAWLFCQKPADPELLGFIVDRAWHLHELEEQQQSLNPAANSPLSGIIATSPEMLEVCRKIEKVAPTDATALLLGDSGTGKELLARSLHELSPRAEQPWIAINCAAIPENLLESELFGYEKGAFTGANKTTPGNVECANGGTLFLDEVGDLPQPLQAKLLRFLQERVIVRVGGRKEIPVDVRVICATHRNLQERIQQGAFREDLYYRISEISITIPALHERQGETVVLANYFLNQYADQFRKNSVRFSPDALAAIERYSWPGNVRELENRVKRAIIMAEGKHITAADLELEADGQDEALPFNLRQIREEAESKALLRAYQYASGNVSQAAELLGITRPTFYSLVKKYNLNIQAKIV